MSTASQRPRWIVPLVLVAIISVAIGGQWGLRGLRESNRERGLALVEQLRSAVLANDIALARAALEAGAPPEWTTLSIDTNLRVAIINGNASMLALLLDHGHKPTPPMGPHPLVSAVMADVSALDDNQSAHLPLTATLLEHASTIEDGDPPPLWLALASDSLAATQWMLDHGADIRREHNHDSALTWCLHHSATAGVRRQQIALLLKAGLDPNTPAPGNITPLQVATLKQDRASAEQLLTAGATLDPLSAAGLGMTTAFLEVFRQAPDSVLTATCGQPAIGLLEFAVRGGSLEILDVLLEAGVNPSILLSGRDPRDVALAANQPAMLLHLRSHLPEPPPPATTDLHRAARAGSLVAVRSLIPISQALDARDEVGNTPLLEAVRHGQHAATAELLTAGSDPLLRNHHGEDALAMALDQRDLDLITQIVGSLPEHPAASTSLAAVLADARQRQVDEAIIAALAKALADLSAGL